MQLLVMVQLVLLDGNAADPSIAEDAALSPSISGYFTTGGTGHVNLNRWIMVRS